MKASIVKLRINGVGNNRELGFAIADREGIYETNQGLFQLQNGGQTLETKRKVIELTAEKSAAWICADVSTIM